MRAPHARRGRKAIWERTVARYLTAVGVPIKWEGHLTGFTGIRGFTLRRISPQRQAYLSESTWNRMPEYFRSHSDDRNLIVVITNRKYGDDIEDSLVVMRLGTFGPLFSHLINSDRERYLDAS